MDLAKSFRKFFNYKRHYVVKELRSGKLKMAIGPCVIDEENEIYDESIHTDYINIRYSVCVNCYSAKEAVEIAAQRIQVEKEKGHRMSYWKAYHAEGQETTGSSEIIRQIVVQKTCSI